jgi:hypothetical protein
VLCCDKYHSPLFFKLVLWSSAADSSGGGTVCTRMGKARIGSSYPAMVGQAEDDKCKRQYTPQQQVTSMREVAIFHGQPESVGGKDIRCCPAG